MKKLISIGEALIDFIPTESGKKIKQVDGFKPAVGGAPANVCAAFTKLGGESKMITQLGEDPFGDKIIDEFRKYNIEGSNWYNQQIYFNQIKQYQKRMKAKQIALSLYQRQQSEKK